MCRLMIDQAELHGDQWVKEASHSDPWVAKRSPAVLVDNAMKVDCDKGG